jgi:hypothetical protein
MCTSSVRTSPLQRLQVAVPNITKYDSAYNRLCYKNVYFVRSILFNFMIPKPNAQV